LRKCISKGILPPTSSVFSIEERLVPKVPGQGSELETLPEGQPLIRRALPSDAEKLGVIGPAAYSSAYSYLWNNSVALAEQLDTFSAAAFAEWLLCK